MPECDMLCKTCGFVLYEDDYIVVITMSYHDSEVGSYIIIPRVCIHRTINFSMPGTGEHRP